jgi:hypothetical protein
MGAYIGFVHSKTQMRLKHFGHIHALIGKTTQLQNTIVVHLGLWVGQGGVRQLDKLKTS